MAPLVSAIIPTYNRAALLRRALDSVAAQTYRPLEAVVVDDGSTDDTEAVLLEYQDRLAAAGVTLVWERQANGRSARARNRAMKIANGSLYAFLDSDDLWRPEFVESLVKLLEQHPSAALAFSGISIIDGDDEVWKTRDIGLEGDAETGLLPRPFEQIIQYMPLQTSGVMLRKCVIDELGTFDTDLFVGEDWDLWYRIAKKYDYAYTRRELACNRYHPRNLPKYDCVALSAGVKLNLRHLPDVKDPEARQDVLERIQRQFTLLQEEMLREGKMGNGYSMLLEHELVPRTPRFALGSMLADAPQWVGRSYAWMVRTLGQMRRGVTC
jgi:glycosyltransferase involved in cell wall biosynthesis